MNEIIKEGWITFYRYPCVEGYIDRWFGDSANNPNHSEKKKRDSNTDEYFRIGNSKWYNRNHFYKGFTKNIDKLKYAFTAKEIWKNYFIIKKDEKSRRVLEEA